MIYMLSQCKDVIDTAAAQMNQGKLTLDLLEYSHHNNPSQACSSGDVANEGAVQVQ